MNCREGINLLQQVSDSVFGSTTAPAMNYFFWFCPVATSMEEVLEGNVLEISAEFCYFLFVKGCREVPDWLGDSLVGIAAVKTVEKIRV